MTDKNTTAGSVPVRENFPAGRRVKFNIAGHRHTGRACVIDKAHVVECVEPDGNTVTYSWPFICDNATEAVYAEPSAELQ